ncbi:DUF1656 domain-containing protein [Ferrovum sp. PN-J185]|uniref:DUF1656 domain-containing protein n=1 Tax=Ferrovum sp. PN-J185 TaxID=1356306 RepID=UPI000797077B|nr:DUF1656 domain-containing protein [Ferrovum sp. PN-J185]KXW56236.1 protein AaeX [Ferrovum sp. PN-J185]MCC6068958.1 DUF1656 domain-containing protein [Ferrovum sp. PN-J185]MDE1891062.1 DUF1656 domain-containing protein [Betaproteobacteria bacterium]MDE2055626.1 DUF1656 domain-containing protein [Betaproteobacteria bacterium]
MINQDMIIFGAQLPTLVPVFVVTLVVMWLLDKQFVNREIYNRVWHPALFRTSLFIVIFTLMALLIY